jgi:hypothetical protein
MGRIRFKNHPVPRRQGVIIPFYPLEHLAFDPAGEGFGIRPGIQGPDNKDVPGAPDYQAPHPEGPPGFRAIKKPAAGFSGGLPKKRFFTAGFI